MFLQQKRRGFPYYRNLRFLIGMLLLFLGVEACANTTSKQMSGETQPVHWMWGEEYLVGFEGTLDRRTRRNLQDISISYALRKRAPSSHKNLEDRASRDLERFSTYFDDVGCFAPRLNSKTIDVGGRLRIAFQIDPGAVYTIGSIRVAPEPADAARPERELVLQEIGKVATARRIENAAKTLARWYRDRGYPFAKVGRVRLEVTHAERKVNIVFPVQVGAAASFGTISISGLTRTRSDVAYRKLTVREGEPFSQAKIEESRTRLRGTGLFSTIRLEPNSELDPLGRVPLTVGVSERHSRTVKFGVNYLTDIGFGARAGFEHRNVSGKGNTLEIALPISEVDVGIESSYRIPDFLKEEQTLEVRTEVSVEDTDAYEVRKFALGSGFSRRLSDSIRLHSGVDYTLKEVTQQEEKTRFQLFAFPQELSRNTSDSPLSPSRGSRVRLEATPYINVREIRDAFLKMSVGFSTYVPMIRKPHTIFATRLRLGTITGTSRDEIPANVRYYAGGGGSIRGFEYQTVGPLVDDKPVGGRSLVEASLELRIQATTKIGLVTFVDAGTAAEDWEPASNETLRVGAGGGIRYQTPIGPIRFDAAIPVNRREGKNDEVEFYISIGEAF